MTFLHSVDLWIIVGLTGKCRHRRSSRPASAWLARENVYDYFMDLHGGSASFSKKQRRRQIHNIDPFETADNAKGCAQICSPFWWVCFSARMNPKRDGKSQRRNQLQSSGTEGAIDTAASDKCHEPVVAVARFRVVVGGIGGGHGRIEPRPRCVFGRLGH